MTITWAEATEVTPWQLHGHVWVKRDDLYTQAGVQGGKVRTCWQLAQAGLAAGDHTLVTAGARSSPQVNIVAQVARELGMGCVAYIPRGQLGAELEAAVAAGADVRRTKAGYNNVLRAAAREHCEANPGCTHIPFGMECQAAVDATAAQVVNIPTHIRRLVVPVGSGMSLAGILHGLQLHPDRPQVLGVVVGAEPAGRLDRWAPPMWPFMVELQRSNVAYDVHVVAKLGTMDLDPVYEAKCLPYLRKGDGLWCVGVRQHL